MSITQAPKPAGAKGESRAGQGFSIFRRLVPIAVFTVTGGWILTMAALIHLAPPDGAESSAELATAFESAVQKNDIDEVKRLIDDPPDRDMIESLVDAAKCNGQATRVVSITAGEKDYLQLAASSGACGSLPIAEHEKRWFIDLWAAPIR